MGRITSAEYQAGYAAGYRDGRKEGMERAKDALERIVQWADAYPLRVFPEPDFKKAREVLEAAGMSLDAISASNMRHAIMGVGEIARAALSPRNHKEQTDERLATD